MRQRTGTFRRAAWGAVALSLLTGLVLVPPLAPAAASPATLVASAVGTTWDDETFAWYQEMLLGIARYDTEPEVRAAAETVINTGTVTATKAFVDTGWAAARASANQRKAKARKQVQSWAKTGGPTVREWATRALDDGDYAIGEFVAYGYEIAERLDNPVKDSTAEQERIRGRVEQMVVLGGPTVIAEGSAALGTADPVVIAEFYGTGYFAASQTDFDQREAIRLAVEARNSALEELAALAQVSTAAAAARASILAANIEAMKQLDDALAAMRLGVQASRLADRILEEDKPLRKNGKRGRTSELEALRVEATNQAKRASAAATEADSTIATVNTAAAKLIKSGQARGINWAKVTIAAGLAIQASAAGAETAQHAAEATLADSLALDADANAELHAKNAEKFLAMAQQQATAAEHLAEVAKEQQKIAEDAAARAKKQREIADNAARQAGEHAAKARSARLIAQTAGDNSVDRSDAAVAAHGEAAKAVDAQNAANSTARNANAEVEAATNHCIATEKEFNEQYAKLQKARNDAIAAGMDADVATAELKSIADRTRAAYESAKGWEARARAAAATALAEAERTTAAANRARAAAVKANEEAVTARRASEKATSAAQEAVHLAESAKLNAQRTADEASAAVRESNQAAFQAQIADQAAGASAASAELAVDRAGTADYIAKQFAGVNADARQILQVAAEAIIVSKERHKAAEDHADEATVAADRAAKAAERAIDTVKPAYEAAARAVKSANEAATAAFKAYDAAVDATNQANGANKAAARASQYEQAAWSDASIADGAARKATVALASAGSAAADADRLHKWALKSTTDIHTFADTLSTELGKIDDEIAKQKRIAEEQAAFEAAFTQGLMTAMRCQRGFNSADCMKVVDFLGDKGKEVVDAGKSYLLNRVRCNAGIEAACRAAEADNAAMIEFTKQVGIGLWERVKGTFDGLKQLYHCSPVGIIVDDYAACREIVDQIPASLKALKEHPFELIYLSEWRKNPGKALGMTLFDIGSIFIPIPGAGQVAAVVAKVGGTTGRLLLATVGKLSNGVGRITRIGVRLAGKTDDWAKVGNLEIKIENGSAHIVGGIAKVDGIAYQLRSSKLELSGETANFVNGTIRLDGGKIIIKDGVATLEGANLKVGAPEVGPPIGDLPDGSWYMKENGQEFHLDKDYNDAAKAAIARATENEPKVSRLVDDVLKDVQKSFPDAHAEGLDYRLKHPDSLRRKVFADLNKKGGTPSAVLDGIHDNLRYTFAFPANDYVNGVQRAMSSIEKGTGLKLVKFKNFWSDSTKGYQGINSTWQHPETGQYFELQFHTDESFWLNKGEHPIYVVTRTPGMALEDVQFWDQISRDLWGTVPEPAGAAQLQY